jgi:hypothetical protein
VKIQKDKTGQYEDRNGITAYKPIEEQAAASTPSRAAAPSQQRQPAGTRPAPAANPAKNTSAPWNRPRQAAKPAERPAPTKVDDDDIPF